MLWKKRELDEACIPGFPRGDADVDNEHRMALAAPGLGQEGPNLVRPSEAQIQMGGALVFWGLDPTLHCTQTRVVSGAHKGRFF